MHPYDFAIIGGGIIGLSVGMVLTEEYPSARVLVLEKEQRWAAHQTGRNSGVLHSGIYYKPGSLKAQFARAGNRLMVEFCQHYGIRHDVCGKVIVATESAELPLLENLYQRGVANGLSITRMMPEELKAVEPHVDGLAAIRVPTAGIVDYKEVAATFARLIAERGGDLRLNTEVKQIDERAHWTSLDTTAGTFQTRYFINCAGLHSDRIARSSRVQLDARIVPFRGEYYELRPEKRYLVKHLIYPVPNPAFPFLGVHFTRMIDGGVHAGPNAVLALKREGYRKTDINLRDAADVMLFPGFWKLARIHWREGIQEMVRSFSKAAFVRSLQRLIPEIQPDDLAPSPAGVRAQPLSEAGSLIDDFLIIHSRASLHVCSAPSPAATAAIAIGRAIVQRVPKPDR